MNWTLFDFIVVGILLSTLIIGLFVIRRLKFNRTLKLALAVGLVVFIALIWADGAVGIF